MSGYFVEEMSRLLDEEKQITHKALAAKVDAKIDDSKFFNKLARLPSEFDAEQIDWAYGPVVQSGGAYDLKLTATSDGNNLKPGIILSSFGIRYKTYNSLIGRTYLVDPSKSQEANYAFLLNLHDAVMKEIRDGVVAKDLYNKALSLVRSKKPELENHLTKNIGAGIGIELRDANMILNAKNTRVLKNGMTLAISIGLTDVKDTDSKSKGNHVYSMVITDTIRVGESGPHIFTKDAGIDMDSVSFYFGDEEEPEKPVKEKKRNPARLQAEMSHGLNCVLSGLPRSTRVLKRAVVSTRKSSPVRRQRRVWKGLQAPLEMTTVSPKRSSSDSSPTSVITSCLLRSRT